MKKFLARLERAAVRAAVRPEFRPVEHEVALALAKSILVRVGASSVTVVLVTEVIDRFVR